MSDPSKIIPAHMRALVQAYGCQDSVATMLRARWGGGCNKTLISKKIHGDLDWTYKDIVGLQDALGRYPITHFLAKSEKMPELVVGCTMAAVADAAKEGGEAIAATLAAEQSCSTGDYAAADVEISEGIEALVRLRANVRAKMGVA